MLHTSIGALLLTGASGLYLPGVSPRDYAQFEEVELKVNNLDSSVTQLPYNYYALPFCKPDEVVQGSENLGEIMTGETIQNSPYKIFMNKVEGCKILCEQSYEQAELKMFEEKIREKYSVNWIVDNIPSATVYEVVSQDETGNVVGKSLTAEKGFNLGFVENDRAYLNNHVRISLDYHTETGRDGFRIVGFEVIPYSVDYENSKCDALHPVSDSSKPIEVSNQKTAKVTFTYDVQWNASPVKWASRWDIYLKSVNPEVHWFSITNSICLVLFLSAIIASIVIRALNKDLTRYNALAEMDEEERAEREEDLGWKQVHGDVFRPPEGAMFLSVFVGTGVQLISMTFITLGLACAGLLSPANRGSLFNAFLALFIVMGIPAGYVGARLHKMFGGEGWKRNATRISTFFPGVLFGVFFIVDLFMWSQNSSGAVPFGTLFALLVLWLGISVPLTMAGAYIGDRKPAIEHPTRINHLARAIPEDTPFMLKSPVAAILAGMVPFGAVFVEMYFIMSSVWEHQFYYMFGILAIIFCVLVITCAEVSIFVVYNQLAHENYHWWWRAFLASGSSAFYLALYAVNYYFTEMTIVKFVSTLLYFGYMSLVCFAFFIATGTIGFLATLWFVRKIYATIKID